MTNGLRYFADALPGGRAQLVVDLIDNGRVVQSWPVGSPAPMATVAAAVDQHNGPRLRGHNAHDDIAREGDR